MDAAQEFISEIEAFLKRSGMAPSAFGWESVRDRNFLGDLHEGRMPSLRIVQKVRNFIRSQDEVWAKHDCPSSPVSA